MKSSKTRASISYSNNPGAGDLAVENDRLKAQLGVLQQKLKVQQDYDSVMEKKDREICQLRQDIQNLKNEHENQVDRLREEVKESEQARRQLKEDIEELNNKIVGFEEDLYESKVIQLDLLDQLKMVDAELEEAQQKIADEREKVHELRLMNANLQKGQNIYIAHKYDKIDETLGNFLNSRPESTGMRIMFLRESEGVYIFGQKRVYIKIEKGDQILVRVGGGYMHIDEFIYQYTQSEVDRIERRDVLARFQNKTAIQNISVHKSDSRFELNPINSARKATLRRTSGSPMPVRTESPTRKRRGSGDFSKRHGSRGSNGGRGKITV